MINNSSQKNALFKFFIHLSFVALKMDVDPRFILWAGIAAASPLAIYLLHWQFFMSANVCKSLELLIGKTILITGANTGLGKQAALECAKRQAKKLILACRNLQRAEEAARDIREATEFQDGFKTEIVVMKLDLTSLDSVRTFCAQVNEQEPQLDILVNNAGVFRCPYAKTEDGFEMHLGVNHLGHFLLTNLLLNLLKKSAPARIVVVSSFLYKQGAIKFDDMNCDRSYGRLEAYSSSKLANVLFSCELSRRLKGTGVNVYCANPGIVRTNILRYSIPLLVKMLDYVVGMFFQDVTQGVQTILNCIVSKELENESGCYYTDCLKEPIIKSAKDEVLAKKLWEYSEMVTGLAIQREQ